ncbi:MAG: hypothetical protein M1831_004352 [Alyxoria varia]|nr:MAG: hypothetical protein M1831_004352 [Alyxoria varia]
MRSWSLVLWSLLWVGLSVGEEVEINQNLEDSTKCQGMYSRSAWGGSLEPFILAKFLAYEGKEEREDPIIAAAVFNYKDVDKIGITLENGETQYKCDKAAIKANNCKDYGTYIVPSNSSDIETQAIHIGKEKRAPLKYNIQKTGYYCIMTEAMDESVPYQAVVEFRNAYGELPGAQIPKLPFYGGLTIVYAVIALLWGFLYVQNRSDILPVQNYITATLIFLVVEMLITWGFYDYENRHGSNAGAKAFMVVVSILNAARNSLSFFLLLIVCMGYGVVKPNLGRTMTWVRWLAAAHFVFGVLYAIGSLTVKPEDAGPLILLVVLPLAATGTAFYVWTLNSLGATLKDLIQRKQRVKAMMYRKLWWCILTSVMIIFGFFALNIVFFSGQRNPNFTPLHWQSRWFVLDGWLSIVYLGDVAFIAYLWRPTANNRRFAMSDEISQEDDGFEIASVRDSLDDLDDPENDHANGDLDVKPPQPIDRTESPLPAPRPQRPPGSMRTPTASLDEGETMFAVGEEAEGSSDDDEERQALTSKKD